MWGIPQVKCSTVLLEVHVAHVVHELLKFQLHSRQDDDAKKKKLLENEKLENTKNERQKEEE